MGTKGKGAAVNVARPCTSEVHGDLATKLRVREGKHETSPAK